MYGFHKRTIFLCVFIIVVELSGAALGLKCFFCAGTGSNMPCIKPDPYLRSADCSTEEFRKNCSAPYDTMCTIETHYSSGGPLVQIRGCNNGTSVSYPPVNTNANANSYTCNVTHKPGMYDRLDNLDPRRNETECVWDGQILVCLSKCDTDFCNGPQLDMQTCGSNVPLASAHSYLIFAGIVVVGWLR